MLIPVLMLLPVRLHVKSCDSLITAVFQLKTAGKQTGSALSTGRLQKLVPLSKNKTACIQFLHQQLLYLYLQSNSCMTFYKVLAWIISSINVYTGTRFMLNVLHVLQTSKYSKTATLIYAILFLGMGLAGIYFSFFRQDIKLALWIGIGPWTLALLFLFINMLTGDYK